MDRQAKVQQLPQKKTRADVTAECGNKRTTIPLNKIADPTVLGSGAIASIMNHGNNDNVKNAAKASVEETLSNVKSGNLEDLEAILINQVYVLNGLFNQLVMQGKASLTEPAIMRSLPNHPKTMLNVALKAQNQCRAAVQTINELKNPKKTTFIKNQLNSVQMEVEGIKEQLEDTDEDGSKKLDYRTKATAIAIGSEVEALEVIDGSQDTSR